MFGFGSGHEFRQSKSDASTGGDRGRARTAESNSLVHIQPGKPTQNAHVESFHGRLREECLTVSWFQNLFDARRKIAAWKIEYNEERPHSRLGYKTPKEFAAQASTQLNWGKRPQTPAPCPRPPSPLKPEMGQKEVVVFLRERKLGARSVRPLLAVKMKNSARRLPPNWQLI